MAREGGVARASEKLHLTPQTISGQLGLLEDHLGTPLFSRVGRDLELTEIGWLLLGYAVEIFREDRHSPPLLRPRPGRVEKTS